MNTFFLDSKYWLRYNLLCCKYLDILYPHTGKIQQTVIVYSTILYTVYTIMYMWYMILRFLHYQ